jgi:hypothetical protein
VGVAAVAAAASAAEVLAGSAAEELAVVESAAAGLAPAGEGPWAPVLSAAARDIALLAEDCIEAAAETAADMAAWGALPLCHPRTCRHRLLAVVVITVPALPMETSLIPVPS